LDARFGEFGKPNPRDPLVAGPAAGTPGKGQTEETKVKTTLISSAKGEKLHDWKLISSKIPFGETLLALLF
jgi:hypothetical protein